LRSSPGGGGSGMGRTKLPSIPDPMRQMA
jgi:hypothetical protein